MILRQLLANPGSGGEQDLALLSPSSPCPLGERVLTLEVVAGRKQVGRPFSPLHQPQGIRTADQGGKALSCPVPSGMEMKPFWFKFKDGFRILTWV